MGEAAVDEVDLAGAGLQGIEGGGHFGDHSARDGAVGEIAVGLFLVEGINESGGVLGVAHETGHVGKVDELGGFQGFRERGGSEVGIDIEGSLGFDFATKGRNDGHQTAGGRVEDLFGETAFDFADKADVLSAGGHAPGPENVRSGDGDRASAMAIEQFDQLRTESVSEGFFDQVDRLFASDAKAFDPLGLEPQLCHRGRDGLSTAVDQDGIDAHRFEEKDVAHEVRNQLRIFHHRASNFDEESFTAKTLEIRQSLDEGGGFGLLVSHGEEKSKAGRGVETLLVVFEGRVLRERVFPARECESSGPDWMGDINIEVFSGRVVLIKRPRK